MELGIDPGVIGVLCVIAVGSLLSFFLVTLCCVYNKCCRDGKSKFSTYYRPQVLQNNLSGSAIVRVPQTGDVEHGHNSEDRTLKDSDLLVDAPPTYQMATEYPRVYTGQYYIGMSSPNSGDSDNMLPNTNDQAGRQPPDYQHTSSYGNITL